MSALFLIVVSGVFFHGQGCGIVRFIGVEWFTSVVQLSTF